MEMIYYAGLGIGFDNHEKINLVEEKVLSWKIKKLDGWMSPNLVVNFETKTFEQPIGLIVNYNEVIKYLRKRNK